MSVLQEAFRKQESDSEFALRQLSGFKQKFDPVLVEFLNQELESSRTIQPELGEILKVGTEFVINGGKRLRPAFLYYGYKAAGGEDDAAILHTASCVELVHAGALIHDDIIDNSELRRGNPTVHKSYGTEFGRESLGNSLAILTGDAIAALASKALNSFPVSDERMKVARRYFDRMCFEINLGQYLDVIGDFSGKVDVDWAMKVMRYKTAGYTVEKPLLIGAALGGGSKDALDHLSRYAVPLGIAFQIQDDILGMFGNEEKVGKPIDSDLKEGKKTILVLKAKEKLKERGDDLDLKRFDSILGNKELSKSDYVWAQDLIINTGALAYSRDLASTLLSESKAAIDRINLEMEAKRYLLGIADFMLNREY